MIGIDEERIREVSLVLSNLKYSVDTFDDEDYYPPQNSSKRDIFMYFLVMVSMDHRLIRRGKEIEGVIEGKHLRGSEVLYRLGSIKFKDDPSFFYPEKLSSIKEEDVRSWLSVENKGRRIYPDDIRIRTSLLRDLGIKLTKLYSDPFDIIVESQGFLRKGTNDGFIDLLKVFKAYQDPVEKKAFLLAKFLERRSVLKINDPYNKQLPIDNHLVRVAFRIGMLTADEATLEKMALGLSFSKDEDVLIRYEAREAYRLLSQFSGIDPFILDDIFWSFGRNCCTEEKPSCLSCNEGCPRSFCEQGCIFVKKCKAGSNKRYMVKELKVAENWWY
ncbi:MAG: hypothetical protein G5Z42_02830 [Caldisphaeraceae archaeon]|nr:hypothetical protein [Caldisphaeraceae archaeon]MEB3692562.1 hypothetical protein [Caldisphaeraceae archaeon]MEB3797740.1 hypothetical protein [Caldisphaeraceae archaeon]